MASHKFGQVENEAGDKGLTAGVDGTNGDINVVDIDNDGAQLVRLSGVSAIKGDKGDTGDKGDHGDQGLQGVPDTKRGVATVDFGSSPTDEASVVVTDLTDMTTSTHIEVFIIEDDTTSDNTAEDHKSLAFFSQCHATTRSAGVGFTIFVRLTDGYAWGTFKVHYIYVV